MLWWGDLVTNHILRRGSTVPCAILWETEDSSLGMTRMHLGFVRAALNLTRMLLVIGVAVLELARVHWEVRPT